jgi:hypothetical protein
MSNRHYFRDPLPLNGDFIPAVYWPTGQPTPDPNRRDSAFSRPTIAEAAARRPRWGYNTTTKVLTSRYLTALDAREINETLQDVWTRHGENSVSSIVLHMHPDWCQNHAGVLRAYQYERCIALESSGVEDMAFVTYKPRLWKRESTE